MPTLLEKIDDRLWNRGHQLYDHVETWGNGAIIVAPRRIKTYGTAEEDRIDQPLSLFPGDDLLINGHTCYLGSDRAYNAEYGRRGENADVWINRAGTMICAGRHPDADTLKIKLDVGQLVLVEGNYYRIDTAPNQNFWLKPD